MSKKIKKLIYKILGIDENLMFYIGISSLLVGITFFILSMTAFPNNKYSSNYFSYISGIFFAIWIIITQGSNSVEKISIELIRIIFFFILFIYSSYICLNFAISNKPNFIDRIKCLFSSLGLFLCFSYFTSRFVSIIKFIKSLFEQVKLKLFKFNNSNFAHKF